MNNTDTKINDKEKTKNSIVKNNFFDKAKDVFKQLSLYVAFILLGMAVTAFYFREDWNTSQKTPQQIEFYKAGEVSVSINERSELVFINRDSGSPLVVDSTLTEVINNMLAAREYVKVNKAE